MVRMGISKNDCLHKKNENAVQLSTIECSPDASRGAAEAERLRAVLASVQSELCERKATMDQLRFLWSLASQRRQHLQHGVDGCTSELR